MTDADPLREAALAATPEDGWSARCDTCGGIGDFPNGDDPHGIHCLTCDGTGRVPAPAPETLTAASRGFLSELLAINSTLRQPAVAKRLARVEAEARRPLLDEVALLRAALEDLIAFGPTEDGNPDGQMWCSDCQSTLGAPHRTTCLWERAREALRARGAGR